MNRINEGLKWNHVVLHRWRVQSRWEANNMLERQFKKLETVSWTVIYQNKSIGIAPFKCDFYYYRTLVSFRAVGTTEDTEVMFILGVLLTWTCTPAFLNTHIYTQAS